MAGATWKALKDYAKLKGCKCEGQWTPEVASKIAAFINLPGGNGVMYPADNQYTTSIEDGPAIYLDRKIKALGLRRR